jgi:hypothetical protein
MNEALRDWLRIEEAADGGVALRHVWRSLSGEAEIVDDPPWGVAEADLARFLHALEAAAQRRPQAAPGLDAEAETEAPAWERILVERASERVAIARGEDGRFVLNAQRLVQRGGDGQIFTGVSITLDRRDLIAVARAMIESFDPSLAAAPKNHGEETLSERWGMKLTIAQGEGRGARLVAWRRLDSGAEWKRISQFPIDERELLRLAHVALARREAIEP